MAVLIDPPIWPAHGTRFSHLVSDSSLNELHQFAARAGIGAQAFDGDHYDVSQRLYATLVAQGAIEVSAGDLIRRLRASGLRVRARDRPKRIRRVLRERWNRTLPEAPALGEQLLDCWSEPHRSYHDAAHLLDVLASLDLLCAPDYPPRAVTLAAWFHDAVYNSRAGQDEQASAALAEQALPEAGLAAQEVAEVVRLVELTATHHPDAGDAHGALLCDADLAVLGRPPHEYARYLRQVRAEYPHVSDASFAEGRAAVVRQLLSLDPLYRTERGRDLWADQARVNVRGERSAIPDQRN